VLGAVAAQTPAQPQRAQSWVVIAGHVLGASGKSSIRVALWSEAGFLRTLVEQVRIGPGQPPDFQFTVRPGRWAISAFEDRNENGVLEMGAFGPKAPSGFWRSFHAWRRPRFADVAVQVNTSIGGVDVTLK
jgi:uncharacterized protein (DUF2141 family)